MDKKKKLSLIAMIIGLITLVAGAVMLILTLVTKPGTRDAEYLVEIGQWTEVGEEGVVWNFTEVGKGKLTTNDHKNDYDFIWSLDGDTLKIETSWLYKMNNEFTYKIDQGEKKLTLTSSEESYTFLPYVELDTAGSVDTEVTEDN